MKTKKGNFSLQLKCNDGSLKTLHSLYDPEAEAKALVDAFNFNGTGVLVILGLGLGYHVADFARRFPDSNIIVVEALPEIYELAKRHILTFYTGENVEFLTGQPLNEVILNITKRQMKLGMPPLRVFPLSPVVSAFPDYYQPILNKLKGADSFKLSEKLRYPKFKGDKVRVLLMDFNYFLNAESDKALKLLGHNTLKINGNKDTPLSDIIKMVIEKIVEFKPDFVMTINHLGFDEDGSLTSFLKSIEMPVASWYVDSPDLIVKAFKGNVSPYVSLFLWDRGYIENVKSIGFEDVHYLPLGTDEGVFRPIDPSDKRLNAYRCDVGFVGNSMVEPAGRYISRIKRELHPLIDRIAGAFSDVKRALEGAIDDRLSEQERQIIERFSSKEMMDFEGAILWKATLRYRLSCIQKLKGFKVRIHGDNGWKTLLGNDYYIGCQLNYYKELPLFYNACAINFNATSLQMGQAVNQRVFDVPACGAFVLTDHQKSIEELFDVGTEIATYSDKDEIPELARFYLNNPAEREKRAAKGRERVLREHTYKQRLNAIIKIMKERYK